MHWEFLHFDFESILHPRGNGAFFSTRDKSFFFFCMDGETKKAGNYIAGMVFTTKLSPGSTIQRGLMSCIIDGWVGDLLALLLGCMASAWLLAWKVTVVL